MVGFAKAADHKCACSQTRKACGAFVLLAVKHHVLIHLVADQQHVGGGQNLLQAQHFSARPHGGTGVMRAVDQDSSGFAVDSGADFVKVRPEGAGRERHAHHFATSQLDIGHIAVVTRL